MSITSWSPQDLPKPMKKGDDLAEAKRRLSEYGYVIIHDVLSPDEVDAIRTRLHEQAAAERALGIGTITTPISTEQNKKLLEGANWAEKHHSSAGKEQWIAGLLNKGSEFWPMLTNPITREIVRSAIGDHHHLASYLATILNPGCPLMGLHHDQWYLPNPPRRSENLKVLPGNMDRNVTDQLTNDDPDERINPCYLVQTIWMLTDFTEENGATRIVPKSHRAGVNPPGDVPHPYPSIPAEGPAGSVLIYDARLWHSGGEHRGSEARYALHCTFSAPQLRTMENFMASVQPQLRRQMSEEMLSLLGYRIWHGYGRGGTMEVRGILDPDERPVGRLELTGAD
ncbi:phytanoyl-CoA dioxygenase family protein [Sphingomonas tabacisoli]|uniref:Phytanoyl-CoA dioxygenase family protein n=1 Tax=Sphingomonas tabacisoli TaxID=2249466 RepID=A0ABW4I0K5_9SPHN